MFRRVPNKNLIRKCITRFIRRLFPYAFEYRWKSCKPNIRFQNFSKDKRSHKKTAVDAVYLTDH